MANHGSPIPDNVAHPWGSVPSQRWVQVMAEILSGGVWDASGCGRWPEDLPISAALRRRIERWTAWHDELDARNIDFPKPAHWEMRSDMPIAAFNAEGRAIARALKAELPPDWTVVAVDVDAWCRRADAPDADDRELVLPGTPYEG